MAGPDCKIYVYIYIYHSSKALLSSDQLGTADLVILVDSTNLDNRGTNLSVIIYWWFLHGQSYPRTFVSKNWGANGATCAMCKAMLRGVLQNPKLSRGPVLTQTGQRLKKNKINWSRVLLESSIRTVPSVNLNTIDVGPALCLELIKIVFIQAYMQVHLILPTVQLHKCCVTWGKLCTEHTLW